MDPTPPLDLRDHLALDRTELALERTLLAYARTALGLVAAGVTIVQLGQFRGADGLGWVVVAMGLLVLLAGTWRTNRRWRTLRGLRPSG